MGIPALNRFQDRLAQAIAEAIPREAKHNRAGYAEWAGRILHQKEGYRLAHNWTRGTLKAPPLPTSGTYDGVHYGNPITLGPKFQRGWEALWVQEDITFRVQMYKLMQGIQTQEMVDDPIEENKVELALQVLKTATAVGD
eukprot:3405205-Karenia_brevis.AAC.1